MDKERSDVMGGYGWVIQQQEQDRREQRNMKLNLLEKALRAVPADDRSGRENILRQMGGLYQPHEAGQFLQHLTNLVDRRKGPAPTGLRATSTSSPD
jgi:hypothetical protein